MTCKVLIAEDHQLLRRGLASMVGSLPGFEIVGEASDGKQAYQQAMSLGPDLILMDLSMPGTNGIEAIAAIKRRTPGVYVVALTVYKSDEYVREAFRAGADGYVLKDASFEELVSAMNTVRQGRKFVSPEVSSHLVDSFVLGPTHQRKTTAWDLLTPRERSILKLVAEGRTNREAASYLNLSSKTVEKYRASLMRKLELRNAAELVLVALKMGLIESRDDPKLGLNGAEPLNQPSPELDL